VGQLNGLFIYFDDVNTQWCLSDSLGGSCYLSGHSPCYESCPDISNNHFVPGPCPTPTPTPTAPCNIDYDIVFGCDTGTGSTPTPTPTLSSTPTLTPTPTNICSSVSVDATITVTTPTPTPTPTQTPTPSAPVVRPCNFTGDVTFNTLDDLMVCPQSKQFQDCFNGVMYYSTGVISTPSGDTLEQFMVFEALIDGESKCVSYVGDNNEIIGINNIELRQGPFGYSNLGDCLNCSTINQPTPSMTPTLTATPTMTPTRTLTPTPSSGTSQIYYVFRKCGKTDEYVIQTTPLSIATGKSFLNNNDSSCWTYLYQSIGIPPLNPSFNIINYSGNFFTSIGNVIYNTCTDCTNAQNTTTTTTTVQPITCNIPYTHYKINSCARTTGYIKVNGIIQYSFVATTPVNSYTGTLSVTTGDIVEINLTCLAPNNTCPDTMSQGSLVVTPVGGSYTAEYFGTPVISQTFTVDSSWCTPGNSITLQSNSIGL
jgi:hypothetical protein